MGAPKLVDFGYETERMLIRLDKIAEVLIDMNNTMTRIEKSLNRNYSRTETNVPKSEFWGRTH